MRRGVDADARARGPVLRLILVGNPSGEGRLSAVGAGLTASHTACAGHRSAPVLFALPQQADAEPAVRVVLGIEVAARRRLTPLLAEPLNLGGRRWRGVRAEFAADIDDLGRLSKRCLFGAVDDVYLISAAPPAMLGSRRGPRWRTRWRRQAGTDRRGGSEALLPRFAHDDPGDAARDEQGAHRRQNQSAARTSERLLVRGPSNLQRPGTRCGPAKHRAPAPDQKRATEKCRLRGRSLLLPVHAAIRAAPSEGGQR